MPNQLSISGAQAQKPTRFAPIYTGRWSSGLWTNRSPLRDAATSRQAEKYYGASGDALIAGSNVEITNRLTLARRPGNSVFDSNTYANVDRFEEFRLFNTSTEQIDVMVDQSNALYSLFAGVKTLVWTKTPGAGQTYMQSVGNTLYFGNGLDNKKWLQSLTLWMAFAKWNTPITPFLTTFLIDPNTNIQQLTAAIFPITNISGVGGTITATSSTTLTGLLTPGLTVTFPSTIVTSQLSGQTVTILTVTTNTFTFTFNIPGTFSNPETINATATGGTPTSGATQPTWSTVTPNAGNNFQGGLTIDGTVLWTNRGTPDATHPGLPSVENWGIVAPPNTPIVSTGAAGAWVPNTFFSPLGIIIDINGNVQKVTTAGKSGPAQPTWATILGNTTTDGGVTWTVAQVDSLTWAAHTVYPAGQIIEAGGDIFQLAPFSQITLNAPVAATQWPSGGGPAGGQFQQTSSSSPFAIRATASGTSLSVDDPIQADSPASAILWNTFDASGAVTGTTSPFPGPNSSGITKDFQIAFTTNWNVPVAGQYTITVKHHDGMVWGVNGGATLVSGPHNDPNHLTHTALNSYPIMGGTNLPLNDGGLSTDVFVVNFPTAGSYAVEFDWAYWFHQGRTFVVTANGNTLITGPAESGATSPAFPAYTTSLAPARANVTESAGNFVWNNFGPITDMQWRANTGFTLPNSTILDPNGNTEAPFEAGFTGTTRPTFSTTLNSLTLDNPNLIWINQGPGAAPPPGTISALAGGFQYAIALVNTLDNTVSNASPLSVSTGNFVGSTGVVIPPGSGLIPANIDPQADYVAIFRTVDGGSLPFLIPGTGNSIYTETLHDYLTKGFTDTTPDTGLNNLISAPIAGENTPPAGGAINLTYHLGRIFFSVGNVGYWTSGPDTPAGNGVNGVAPLNFDTFPSLLKRIVPTNQGVIVFSVSDIFLVNTSNGVTIPKAVILLKGIGLLSYNALDVNGALIGFYTTDNQFVILDPGAGVSYVGLPIGDQFRKNDGNPGTSWNAANVYVTWHVDGEDQAWYVSDGKFGWFRLMPTPAPETGLTWSPFATIVGGVKAVQSLEVLPGVHKLLLGPGTLSSGAGSNFITFGVLTNVAVMAGTTITSVPLTTINGDLVLSPGSSVTGGPVVNGATHIDDPIAVADQAYATTLFGQLSALTPTPIVSELGSVTLTPGTYSESSGTFHITGGLTLTLNGNGRYVFQCSSTFITGAGSTIALVGGAAAADVVFVVGSSATIGTTNILNATVLALTSISVNTGTTVNGRLLARNGSVTFAGTDTTSLPVQSGVGVLLKRDSNFFQDNTSSYFANAVLGSINLAQPGQVAVVGFVTTDSVRTGTPLSISVIIDEALPFFNGPFEPLTNWVTDPPNQPESRSIRGQRFYFSELPDQAAVCRHLQCSINFGISRVQDEILTFSIYGSFMQES